MSGNSLSPVTSQPWSRREEQKRLTVLWLVLFALVGSIVWPLTRQSQARHTVADREGLFYAACDYAGDHRPDEPDLLYLGLVHNSPPYKVVMYGPNHAQVSFHVSTKNRNTVSPESFKPISETLVVTAARGKNGYWMGTDVIRTKHRS